MNINQDVGKRKKQKWKRKISRKINFHRNTKKRNQRYEEVNQ
jgi:hypothetical protein